jgi:hypothetical protein
MGHIFKLNTRLIKTFFYIIIFWEVGGWGVFWEIFKTGIARSLKNTFFLSFNIDFVYIIKMNIIIIIIHY